MTEGLILNLLDGGRFSEALALVTPELACTGVLNAGYKKDLMTLFCSYCDTEKTGLRVAKKLIKMGYAFDHHSQTRFCVLAEKNYCKLIRMILILTNICTDSNRLNTLVSYLNRKQLEIFLEHGTKSLNKDYRAFQTAREKARIASIALISVGRRSRLWRKKSAKDVFRVISRVVWSERDDEKWMK